jgi:hypothetical protein
MPELYREIDLEVILSRKLLHAKSADSATRIFPFQRAMERPVIADNTPWKSTAQLALVFSVNP